MAAQSEPEKREQFFMYHAPGMGIFASPYDEFPFHLTNYFLASTFARDLQKREVYFDFGCGSGYGTELVGTMFEASYGYDPNPRAIEYAKVMHGRSGTYFQSRFNHGLCPQDISFVTMIECVEHIQPEELDQALGVIVPSMASRAMLFITTPVATTSTGQNHANPYHVHEYHPGELRDHLYGYLKEVEITEIGAGRIGVSGTVNR